MIKYLFHLTLFVLCSHSITISVMWTVKTWRFRLTVSRIHVKAVVSTGIRVKLLRLWCGVVKP